MLLKTVSTFLFLFLIAMTALLCHNEVKDIQVTPLIVAWTKFWQIPLKQRLLSASKYCSNQCVLINREEQRLYNRDASAYIFHGPDMNLQDLPSQTSPHLNILFLMESSLISRPRWPQMYQVPHDYFNATMTYRRDSRYYHPYGRFEPRSVGDPADKFYTEKQLHQAIGRKSRGSLLFISRCKTPSNRENIIRELGKFTDITARGICEKLLTTNYYSGSAYCKSDCTDDALIGPLCSLKESPSYLNIKKLRKIAATHRFYIAFENSICKEYITEKFFDRISHLLVPIVLKRHIYEDAGVPSDSFIAVDDFGSLEDLGMYLNFLRQNDTAYLRYFEWTKHFRKPNVYQTDAICKLCEDIHKKTDVSLNNIDEYLDAHECEQNAHYTKFWQLYIKNPTSSEKA